jgi:hypothetical protein
MAAFFICRDFNAHPGLPWCRNDRAIIISLGHKRDEVTKPIFIMISPGAIWMGAAFARSYTPDTIKTCGEAVAKLGQRLASPFNLKIMRALTIATDRVGANRFMKKIKCFRPQGSLSSKDRE